MAVTLEQIGTVVGVILIIIIYSGLRVYRSYKRGIIKDVIDSSKATEVSHQEIMNKIDNNNDKLDKLDTQTDQLQNTIDRIDGRVGDVDDRVKNLAHAVYEIHKLDRNVNRERLRYFTGVEKSVSDITILDDDFTRSADGDIEEDDDGESGETDL